MKKSSVIIWLLIAVGVCAAVWFLAKFREELPYKEFEKGYYYNAIPALTKRAEKGDAKAQHYLGWWFADQQKDGASALEWWQKASESGYAPATYSISYIYLNDELGIKQNIPLARAWRQKAVEQGYEEALMELYEMDLRPFGRYYRYIDDTKGEMAAQAVSDAAPKWLEQSILLGNTNALSRLSVAYSGYAYPVERAAELIPAVQTMEKSLQNKSGKFVHKDEEFLYYQLLGVLYFAEEDYANAFNYLEKAANLAEHAAQQIYSLINDKIVQRSAVAYHLGRIYEEGLGMERNARKAREIYATTPQELWTKDDRLAVWHLAMMQAQGCGGDVDKESAAKLLHQLESMSRDDVSSPAVLAFPSAEQMDALREAIAAP